VVELEHPHTIKFYDFGQTDAGELYIAMEFVDGQALSEVVEKEGAMSFDRVENIMKQICGSLHEAHELGIVHRDLKPENVILCKRAGEQDFVKVLDFGIAKRQDAVESAKEQKLTQAGMVLGTPPYMSPEQFTGKELGKRSDIYALGVMAYEMLTGQLPFKANTPWEWATQHMTQQPSPFESTGAMAAQIPPAMKAACMKALSKNQEDRQPTAKAFYAELCGGGAAPTVGAGAATQTAPGSAAPGSAATEAFSAMPLGAGGGGPPRAGATQVGEPFVPPMEAQPVAMPMGGSPHQNVPTAGGQAMPAAPMPSRSSGGGNKGVLMGAAAAVAELLGVGLVIAFSGGNSDTEETEPLIGATSAEPDGETKAETGGEAAGGGTSDTADSAEPATSATTPQPTSVNTNKTTTTTQPPDGTAACDQAISAAMGKNCGAARSALAKCTGFKRNTAAANVQKHCKPKFQFKK
jgi:serine/threonine-protein kinase